MKNLFGKITVAFFALLSIITSLNAKPMTEETAKFKVYGNCSMCKKRIEIALLKNQNIKKATWDVDTKMLTVVYNPATISLENIHKIIADAGHDTDLSKANDANYNSLPGCCKYERKK